MAKDTNARMLESASRLLLQRGYHGTSLSDILAASGAPRGSLYFHFPGGKDQLVIEATRTTIEVATRDLRAALAGPDSPGRGVQAYAEAAADLMLESDYTFGCPVAPMILDAPDDVTELVEICRKAFHDWAGIMREAFIGAGIAEVRAAALARTALATIEGALIMARSDRDADVLRETGAELQALIDGAAAA